MPKRKPGTLFATEIAALQALKDGQAPYSYALARDHGWAHRTTDELLKRLAGMGLLTAEWQPADGRSGPPRRVYRLTAKDRRALRAADAGPDAR